MCSGRKATLLPERTPSEMKALSLFKLGLSCGQVCLRGSERAATCSTAGGRGSAVRRSERRMIPCAELGSSSRSRAKYRKTSRLSPVSEWQFWEVERRGWLGGISGGYWKTSRLPPVS